MDTMFPDWLQASWETLVEGQLGLGPHIYLYVYAGGADLYGRSSRIFMPDAEPTHAVVCHARDGDAAVDGFTKQPISFPARGFVLEQIVGFDGDHKYTFEPPFDHVLVGYLESQRIFRMSDVRFDVRPLVPEDDPVP